jgi:predicted house-cleaning NTP pyrophosphatase (Maf/HAM1 superfamily)
MLKSAGVEFEVLVPDVDEAAVKARGGTAREVAETLAALKALLPLREKVSAQRTDEGSRRPIRLVSAACAEGAVDPSSDPLRGPPSSARGEGDVLIIGSDQTLELDGELISKATSLTELRDHLVRLRGRTHALHAAVAVARDGAVVWSHTDTAILTMRAFSDAFLDDYLAQHGEQVCSSLGGYWFEAEGAQLFDTVEGDYFTILGMPLLPLLGFLRGAGAIAS